METAGDTAPPRPLTDPSTASVGDGVAASCPLRPRAALGVRPPRTSPRPRGLRALGPPPTAGGPRLGRRGATQGVRSGRSRVRSRPCRVLSTKDAARRGGAGGGGDGADPSGLGEGRTRGAAGRDGGLPWQSPSRPVAPAAGKHRAADEGTGSRPHCHTHCHTRELREPQRERPPPSPAAVCLRTPVTRGRAGAGMQSGLPVRVFPQTLG